VPIIPQNWKAGLIDNDESTWSNPDFDKLHNARIPFHASKYVNYRKSVWMYDTDKYYGNNDFNWDDNLHRDELLITYYYQIDDYSSSPKIGWEVTYYSKNGVNVEIGLEKAKEILSSWGLTYP
jgi:hypothetical protein